MTNTPHHAPESTALITVWRKSRHSIPASECTELGPVDDGTTIAMRNSRDPQGPALLFDGETTCELICSVSDGALDWLLEDYSRFEQLSEGGTLARGGSGESGPGA